MDHKTAVSLINFFLDLFALAFFLKYGLGKQRDRLLSAISREIT